jgi:serine/threonine protein kinase/regulator of sirC expression with transglutaminase-like and TPR domain
MNANPNRAREIFVAALKLAPDQWDTYLNEACGNDEALRGRVQNLLAAHKDAGNFLEPAGPGLMVTIDDPLSERPGMVIGPYKLLEQIGEGGFGVVYMAEQTEPIRRKVALKVLKPGMDTHQVVARFEAERQALAIMDHANIAKVFDGGATPSGRPYFVMELVRGSPITEFCDQNHLPPRERLELFVSACQAVQHAHQKGIIHRDLKPSNVLVSLHDGKPLLKIIDFGVAKALGQELTDKTLFTGFAQMIGTPLYMSPEQAGQSLDIDTRSDIYSLGVMLYELLTGTTPFNKERFKQAAYEEIRRIIREEEPPRPSTRLSDSKDSLSSISAQRHTEPAKLTKLVKGELDWIVMKALEKDRNRRYETANGFAMDVQRYLADEPVQACPPSAWYRWRKFARRHRQAVAVGLVLSLGILSTLIVLAVSTVLISRERAEAVHQKNQAEENFKMAKEAIDGFYTKVSESDLFDQPGAQPLRKQLLEDARKFYERILQQQAADPHLQAELAVTYFRVWQIYGATNRYHEGNETLRMGLDIAEKLYRDRPEDVQLYKSLASYRKGGASFHRYFMLMPHLTRADRETLQRAATFWERLTLRHPGVPEFKLSRADAFAKLNEYEKAAEILTGLARENPMVAEYQEAQARAQVRLGNHLADVGRLNEAEKAIRLGLDFGERMAKRFPGEARHRELVGEAYCRLIKVYGAGARYDEAEKVFCQGRDSVQRLVDEFPKSPAYIQLLEWMYEARANTLSDAGRFDDAEKAARQRVALDEKLAAEFPGEVYEWRLAPGLCQLGRILKKAGKAQDATRALRRSVAVYEKSLTEYAVRFIGPSDLRELADTYNELLQHSQATGEPQEANKVAQEAIGSFQNLAEHFLREPPHRELVAECYRARGFVLTGIKQDREAQEAFEKALELYESLPREYSEQADFLVRVADIHEQIAHILKAANRLPEAEQAFSRAIAGLAKAIELRPSDPEAPWWHMNRANAYIALKKDDEALADLNLATERWPTLWDAWVWRGGYYYGRQQWPQVIADFTKALELNPRYGFSWHARAVAHANLKQWDNALADFTKLIELSPDQAAGAIDSLRALGRKEDADALLRRAIAQLEKQATEAPDSLDKRMALADLHAAQAKIFEAAEKLAEAEKAYRRALAMLQKPAADARPAYRNRLATAHYHLGGVQQRIGQRGDAEKNLRQAIAIWTRLADNFPREHARQRDMATRHLELSRVLREAGKPQEAEKALSQALAISDKLLERKPTSKDDRFELATVYREVAREFLADPKGVKKAGEGFRQAWVILEKLAAEYPDTPHYLHLAGDSLVNQAHALRAGNRPKEAEQAFRQGIASLSKLVARFPKEGDFPSYLGWARAYLAGFLMDQKRPAEAEAEYRQALADAEKAAADFPDNTNAAELIGHRTLHLGWHLVNMNRHADAEKVFLKGARACEENARRLPSAPILRWFAAVTRGHAAGVMAAQKRAGPAQEQYRKAVEILLALPGDFYKVESRPKEADHWFNALLGELRSAKKDRDAAVSLQQVADFYRRLAADHPGQPYLPQAAAKRYLELAVAHHKLNHMQEARKWYNRAVEWMNKHSLQGDELRRLRTDTAKQLGVPQKKD